MTSIQRSSLFLFLLINVFTTTHAQKPTYTYPQLVDRLTNLELLAKLPAPGEKTALASSYDRSSQYDAATDKYIDWSANGDGSGHIRQEGDTFVLMDVKGPGVIWRMWTANSYPNHVRIYLDGATTPTIDLPSSSYFDGTVPPFNRPNLVYAPMGSGRGLDNYIPISFNNGCKIVADKDWRRYFHFNYTLFPAGTTLPTFTMNLSPADNIALDRANRILGDSGHAPPGETSSKTQKTSILAQPNATETVADLKGAGAITAIKVKLDLPKDSEAQRILLRQLTLSITWDNESTPAVWSPLGDFFAYVGGADVFQSYPVGLLEDGTFYAYWYMPYGTHAHIVVGNDGPTPIRMLWEIDHAHLHGHIQDFMRFHAKWHRNAFLPTRPDRAIDWTLLTTTGTGRFVGTHLHGWNPRGSWWGEGDEKFFIDGEKFPSTFGTGSEDYFGYAWGSDGHFSRPYHNQILNEANAGHFDDNRWHISDSVPFQTSFEGDIEKYFAEDRTTLYAAEVFWYLKPGGLDPYEPTPIKDRIGYWIRPKIYQEPGAIEAETLEFVAPRPTGSLQRVDMYRSGKDWSSDRQLIWTAVKPAETLSLHLPIQKAGKYRLIVRFTNDATNGIFQLLLNDQPIGLPIDLYSPVLKAADPIDLGIVTIPDGQPILKITSTGKNPASTNFNFGFDYLKLIPIPDASAHITPGP